MNLPAFADLPRARSGRGALPLYRLIFLLVAVLWLTAFVPSSLAIQLVPGVYGYGLDRSENSAGFGPGAQVIEVTNLTDSGAGTFREAVTKVLSPTTAPRIIVFKTSGVIDLKTQVLLEKPNLTIAGQTAPYPGVALHGAPLVVLTDNVLIQHLRMRAGDRWYNTDINKNVTSNRDSMQLSSGTVGVKNVVFDHCTFGWSLDECVSGYNGYDNVTFNKCLFAEPLHLSIHMDEGIFAIPLNRPQQAQDLPYTLSSATASTPSSTSAMSGNYQLLTASVNGAYVEYTLTIANGAAHTGCSIGLTGLTGSNRGKFRIYVYNSGGTLLQTSNEMDMYAPAGSEAQVDFIARGVATFDLPVNPAPNPPLTYRVRVQVTAPNAANGGRNLGIDQFYIAQPHAMGPYFGDGYTVASAPYKLPGKLTMIGNAFAHLQARGPWVGSQDFYFANNVLYHRRRQMLQLGVVTTYRVMRAAVIGNTFMEGRQWNGSGSPIRSQNPPPGSQYYVDLGSTSPTRNKYDAGTGSPPAIYNATSYSSDTTAKTDGLSGFVPRSTDDAYADVLLNAGARPNERDDMEQRVIGDIAVSANLSPYTARQGSLKNSVAEAGGWPVYAVNASTWTLPANPNGDDDSDGYTNIEEWLHDLSQALEVAPSAPPAPGTLQAEAAALSGGAVARP